MDKVLSLRLADQRTVAEMLLPRGPGGRIVEPSEVAERALRTDVLVGCDTSAPRQIGGGVEVDVWLPTIRLGEILRDVAAKHLPGVDRTKFVLHPSTGPSVTATGCYVPDGRPRDNRPGWRQCMPEQMVQTRDAVQSDVRRRLLDHIGFMRLPGGDRLRLVMARFPAFRDAMARRVSAVPLGDPIFEPIGVCRLTFRISHAQVRALAQAAAADARESGLPAEITDVSEPAGRDPIVIEGSAVPMPYAPPSVLSRSTAESGRPEWADRVLSATGTATAPAGVTDDRARRDLALKAARVEAGRKLWIEIEKLTIPSGTVGAHLAGHARPREALAAIDALFVPMSSPSFDAQGRATVTLGIRLDPLWRAIRDLK